MIHLSEVAFTILWIVSACTSDVGSAHALIDYTEILVHEFIPLGIFVVYCHHVTLEPQIVKTSVLINKRFIVISRRSNHASSLPSFSNWRQWMGYAEVCFLLVHICDGRIFSLVRLLTVHVQQMLRLKGLFLGFDPVFFRKNWRIYVSIPTDIQNSLSAKFVQLVGPPHGQELGRFFLQLGVEHEITRVFRHLVIIVLLYSQSLSLS